MLTMTNLKKFLNLSVDLHNKNIDFLCNRTDFLKTGKS